MVHRSKKNHLIHQYFHDGNYERLKLICHYCDTVLENELDFIGKVTLQDISFNFLPLDGFYVKLRQTFS